MKIQIDTKNKTIKLDQDINIGEFIDTFSQMFPDWKDYILVTTTIVNNVYSPPITMDKDPFRVTSIPSPYPYPNYTDNKQTVITADQIKKGKLVFIDNDGQEIK